ncbi:MAG: ATP-binding cassette domain-containing protein [Hydrotalea flava]|nr:ATP-binding cassette domain-containing protein [Hydrotalea flava]NIM37352.1 ATP-binding cassette domain-containing protein [Hydrotalea flava]NIN02537.1 ATP-binding cassette domain-containing protein [Hydrotalea flava]NIN14197.1 ATP-binding cassette domain-containing protein [Hydrotalea flava]NIO93278.1 ATP-binding cassette domain-containing protein [Hydrotalea flava]
MKQLSVINKYFWKYKTRFLLGILFIILSNYFRILAPQVSGYVVDQAEHLIQQQIAANTIHENKRIANYDFLVQHFIKVIQAENNSFSTNIFISAVVLFLLALIGGFFMFLMRQTIIVMSRHIEFDQKNEIFTHYQQLDAAFYKTHSTGDLMNRITEDVSRVRMYAGPAVMYFINLAATIGFCLFFMFQTNWHLTLYVLSPLPILAITIYYVNTIINRKSEKIQALLSDLTTAAQESYSGIRVIKSFVQEKSMLHFFDKNSEEYKKNAIGLAKVEAIYFPSMTLLIGISTLLTIAIGGWYLIHQQYNVSAGTILEFVIYINMLTFPVSAIGWTASMIQRAAASQKRINEFLNTTPEIQDKPNLKPVHVSGDIHFNQISFTYPNTGIQALSNFNLTVQAGQKVLLLGRTGSGKSTVAQLLLHFYNPDKGNITIGGHDIQNIPLRILRKEISYIPQDVFLFSDTIANNIAFGQQWPVDKAQVEQAAKNASIHNEIMSFDKHYETLVGERGVTLSGGQKQRISIARALIKQPEVIVFDDCLSAVDAKTENEIVTNLYNFLKDKTGIIITHRIFSTFRFDKIVVLEDGEITEEGTHESLMQLNGYYAELYRIQVLEKNATAFEA